MLETGKYQEKYTSKLTKQIGFSIELANYSEISRKSWFLALRA